MKIFVGNCDDLAFHELTKKVLPAEESLNEIEQYKLAIKLLDNLKLGKNLEECI